MSPATTRRRASPMRSGAQSSECSGASWAASSAAVFGDMLSRRCASSARRLRDSELLARPGISGGHARHELHDRGGLRPGRRRRSAGRDHPRNRAGGADPGARQPPDAGMGKHPPAEREPNAARARRGAADRTAGHGPSQPRPVPQSARRRLRRRRSGAGRHRRPDLHPSRPAHLLRRAAGLSDAERHDGWRSAGRQGRPCSAAAATTAVSRTTSSLVLQQLAGGQVAVGGPAVAAHASSTASRPPITTARANTSSGAVDVSVVRLSVGARTRSTTSSCSRAGGAGIGPFVPMVQFDPPDHARPKRRRSARGSSMCVRSRPGDTVQSLASRMAYRTFQLDRFLSLNNLAAN